MTEAQIALAKRAVACESWRWMPGMLVVGSQRHGAWPFRVCHLSPLTLRDDPGALPDLTDPATLGCLLALVREAWGDPTIVTAGTRARGWIVDWDEQSPVLVLGVYATEAEALVAALEAAP